MKHIEIFLLLSYDIINQSILSALFGGQFFEPQDDKLMCQP
jgi:hypothetical protein